MSGLRKWGMAPFLVLAAWVFPCSLAALPAKDVRPINNREYFPAVLDLLNNATQRIRIILYLAQRYDKFPAGPTNQLLQALAQSKKRGVDIEVILEEPGGKGERSIDLEEKNLQVRRWLQEAGVKAFGDSLKVTTHAKVLVVDGRYTIIGSTNWTYAALVRNNEAAVIVDSPSVAEVYERLFDQVKPKAGDAGAHE